MENMTTNTNPSSFESIVPESVAVVRALSTDNIEDVSPEIILVGFTAHEGECSKVEEPNQSKRKWSEENHVDLSFSEIDRDGDAFGKTILKTCLREDKDNTTGESTKTINLEVLGLQGGAQICYVLQTGPESLEDHVTGEMECHWTTTDYNTGTFCKRMCPGCIGL